MLFLTFDIVRHVSFLPKQLVDLFVKTMVKARIPLCARESRKRLTHLQGEELACPAEDDEQVDELVDEPVDELVDEPVDEGGDEKVELQEEEQPEQDLHAAEILLRRVHANLGHPSKGLMLRLLRDANAPPEMLAAPTLPPTPSHLPLLPSSLQKSMPTLTRARDLFFR